MQGHDERPEVLKAIFINFCSLKQVEITKIKAWLKKRECTSPDIINDMIKLMGTAIRNQILAKIKGSRWYAFIADETTDISHTEQIS